MAVLAEAFDIDLKVVSGYNGNADTALAVIKGDGDGHITGWSASLAVIEKLKHSIRGPVIKFKQPLPVIEFD